MLDSLERIFGWVCGQNPAHTWSCGGLMLPCCQRCTGLYVAVAVACALALAWPRRFSARELQFHGLLLLQMVPLGFHWLPHGSIVRTMSGVLFGFGLVCFLSLLPRANSEPDPKALRGRNWFYYGIMLATVTGLLFIERGGLVAGQALTLLAVIGLGSTAVLAGINMILLARAAANGLAPIVWRKVS